MDDNGDSQPFATASPTGLSPTRLRGAYGIDAITFSSGTIVGDGSGQTIAIVDAFDDPRFFSSSDTANYPNSDMAKFCTQFSPPGVPTFTKMNQSGGSTYPASNGSWATEIALDVEWAHAIAPQANIVLVEATTNGNGDLFAAANFAGSIPGVVAVSMSWGSGESSGETSSDNTFNHPGVTYFASTGDSGAPGGYPAYSPNVVAVGGTHLSTNLNTWLSETGWGGSGGGISTQELKPSYQSSVTQSASRRTIPDVAMDADPNSGVPVYDTFNNSAATPWEQFGGTSLSSPLWAGLMSIIAQGRSLLGQAQLSSVGTLTQLYQLPQSDFHDIISGSNGFSAGIGYDLVTGRGTPIANLLVPAMVGVPSAPTGLKLATGSDSGMSSSDGITNVNTPTFTGQTLPNASVQLLIGNTLVGTGTADGAGVFSIASSVQTDGAYGYRAIASNAAGTGPASNPVAITIDTTAPTLQNGSTFVYDNVPTQRLTYAFSEKLGVTPQAGALALGNTTTSQSVAPAQLALSMSGNTAVFTFPGFSGGVLPDGQYTATLSTAGITDVAGNPIASPDATSSFFFLQADANHDGTVDVSDLGILATNWQGSGSLFSQGDFNYDGLVDVSDLGLIATNWQKTVMPPAPASPLGRTSLATTTSRMAVSSTTSTRRSSARASLTDDLLA